jgi:hypothetical protein
MIDWIKMIWAYIVSLFVSERGEPSEPKAKKAKERPQSGTGYFTFKKSILDDLASYFTYIRRLRKQSRSAYAMLMQFGAKLVPPDYTPDYSELPAWWRVNEWPAFGAFAMPKQPDLDAELVKKGWTNFRLSVFEKTKQAPWFCQRLNDPGEVYHVMRYYDDVKRPDGCGYIFYVHVNSVDGKVTLLKELKNKSVEIPSKNGKASSWYNKRDWFYNDDLVNYVKDYPGEYRNAQELAAGIFISMVNLFTDTFTDIQVKVSKDDLSAAFSIATKRTAYFFKDRDIILNDKGNRKRIFHVVRPHQRQSGKLVKMHFRGMREFNWNGYGVKIFVPGLHEHSLYEFPLASEEFFDDLPPPKGMLTGRQGAKKISEVLEMKP